MMIQAIDVEYLRKTVMLPVCGLEAEVREGDGNAEAILRAGGWGSLAKNLPSYWAHLTVRIGENTQVTAKDILDLALPDQHVLGVEIWRCNYGDLLELSGACPGCGDPMGFGVPLDQLELRPMPAGGPIFEKILPRSGKKVLYGYITGHQEMLQAEVGDGDLVRLDYAAIKSVDGQQVSYEEVRAWKLRDSEAFRKARAKTFCGYDTTVKFTHSCGRGLVVDLLTDPSFLVPGLAALARE